MAIRFRERALIVCLLGVSLLSLLPVAAIIESRVGFDGVADSAYIESYYSPMIKEVADGHVFMGNPFFFEHRDDIAPAFVLPFWIAAIPLLIGIPVSAAFVINFLVWSVASALILYFFFRRLTLPPSWSALGVVTVYVVLYGELIRPVSAQIVLPMFYLFLLAFLLWWERHDIYRDLFLGMTSAVVFYVYTYLFQIGVIFLGLVFLHLLYMRDWVRVRHALIVGVCAFILSIPFLIFTYMQLHHPYYIESMIRIGLSYSHLPSGEAARSGMFIGLFIAFAYLLWKWTISQRYMPLAPFMLQFLFLGITIEILSVSNMVTGLDLETASHAARFVKIWLIIGTVVAAFFFYSAWRDVKKLPLLKRVILVSLAVAVVACNLAYYGYPTGSMFRYHDVAAVMAKEQKALKPLRWIDSREKEPQVIWTNPRSDLYFDVVLYSRNYVLYGSPGILQLLPTSETEERYLVASATSGITLKTITDDVWYYDGAGAAADTPNTLNRPVKYCRALHLETLGYSCGEIVDARTLYSQHYADMYAKLTNDIQPDLVEKLRQYHVTYAIKDAETDVDFHPESVPGVTKVYSDGRFEIYRFH